MSDETAHGVTSLGAASGGPASAALASIGTAVTPTDQLLTLPPPVLRLLVLSAPFVQALTTFSQLLTWTHPNKFACFLVPLGWTALCLGGRVILTFGLNALILAFIGISWMAKRGGKVYTSATARDGGSGSGGAASAGSTNSTTAGSNANGLQVAREPHVRTLSLGTATQPAVQVLTPTGLNSLLHSATILSKHLQILSRTFSPLLTPFNWRDPALSWATINLLLTSYPFYLLLTYFVPLRHIVLFLGLTALLWEAPWFATIRRALWASLLVRRSARVALRILQGDIRIASSEATDGPANIGLWARLRSLQVLSAAQYRQQREMAAGKSMHASDWQGRSRSGERTAVQAIGGASTNMQRRASETIEIQYLFTIFENQRWWIGLEWTQALLPNERPSWSDPVHLASSPPGAFVLPASTTVTSATEGVKRTFVWKWLDPEWHIRGTAGVFISPGTIGANPNPAVAGPGNLPGSTKELKDAMGASLGDWKNMLANRGSNEDAKAKEARRQSLGPAGLPAMDDKGPPSPSSGHARKGSTSIFGEGLSSLIGAKDGKPVMKGDDGTTKAAKERRGSETSNRPVDEHDDPDDGDILGHPKRLDEAYDTDFADWTVDSQGWAYGDNHWEKPSSKGGMGRYTRRRAWVRRAIVVERVETLDPVSSAQTTHSKKLQ